MFAVRWNGIDQAKQHCNKKKKTGAFKAKVSRTLSLEKGDVGIFLLSKREL